MASRGCGILAHITSLPSGFGIGDLGPGACRFVDWLARGGQRYWQILPITPVNPGGSWSPYHATSAFAYNPLLVSPELLCNEGLLERPEIEGCPSFPGDRVDFPAVLDCKRRFLDLACRRCIEDGVLFPEYERYAAANARWLDDYGLFSALKSHFGGKSWVNWPHALRTRTPGACAELAIRLQDEIAREKCSQFLAMRQWAALRRHCEMRGVQVIGDMPVYVDHDSVDVWAHQAFFNLDAEGHPITVAGVPPDYFSETGQRWGNPVFRWDALRAAGFSWWIERVARNLALFDLVRIDHFRGLVAYWEIDAGEATAIHGRWVSAPVGAFLRSLQRHFACLPIIAEDLGDITADVREVMREFGLPGMRVLHFAFGDNSPESPHIPHNVERNSVYYTGTHDNNTSRGWYEEDAGPGEKQRLSRYTGREVTSENVHRELARLALMSVADLVVIPLQDIIGLGAEGRMNCPGTVSGNWVWRVLPSQLDGDAADRLAGLCALYGRS
ncbi:MAG: 4-alpha-glucanotransferase [Methanomicrobiaceae archaeon]|nr:4-alpha-glucanotransferase [Methanomicrobiaceae archaeon]